MKVGPALLFPSNFSRDIKYGSGSLHGISQHLKQQFTTVRAKENSYRQDAAYGPLFGVSGETYTCCPLIPPFSLLRLLMAAIHLVTKNTVVPLYTQGIRSKTTPPSPRKCLKPQRVQDPKNAVFPRQTHL